MSECTAMIKKDRDFSRRDPEQVVNPSEFGEDENWSLSNYFYRYIGVLLLLTGLCGVLSCLNLSLPYILKIIIDDILPEQNFVHLAYALAAVLVILVLKNLAYYVTKVRITKLGEQIAVDTRVQLFHHLQKLSMGFFERNKPGKLSSRMTQDVNAVKSFIKDNMMKILMNVLMVLVSFCIMFWLHTHLAVIALIVLPFHWLVHRMYQRSIKEHAREAQNIGGAITGDIIELFTGVQEMKSSSSEKREKDKLKATMMRGMTARIKETKQYLRQKILADGLVGFGQFLIMGFGAYAIMNGTMKVGTFIAFYGYTGMLYPKTLKLISQAGKFSSVTASIDRISEIMQTKPEIQEKPTAMPRRIQQGRVQFCNVSFSYDEEPILKNVDLTVNAGEHVLITGASGAGKSTLLNLIPRFYELDSGQVRIDNLDVRDYTLASLREQIGIVFQDGFLFDASVEENIRYARPEASDEEILTACRQANAHEFLMKYPEGYQTMIGEEGVHLSCGEKQRLILARIILKDPMILMLDEAMNTLDLATRRKVAGNLLDQMAGRTIFTVTHNPSVFSNFDRQIQLENGRVHEINEHNHREIIRVPGAE